MEKHIEPTMNYRRVFVPEAVYFFTINLQDRSNHLLTKEIDLLRQAFRKIKSKYPFAIEGIVVLPNHLHMLIKLPPNDDNYPLRIRLLKSAFSYEVALDEKISLSRRSKRERGIWQRRYWEHLIKNERDFEHHLNYIFYNPVKHGYVKCATDWPYSSIHRDIKLGIISADWSYCDDNLSHTFGE